MTDRYEKLDAVEHWFHDGFKILPPAGFFLIEEVDMQTTKELIAQLRQQGIKGTYTHFLVRAVALAFSRHPELNRLFLHNKMLYPGTVNLGLAVSSNNNNNFPFEIVLQDAASKTVVQLTEEVSRRAAEMREKEPKRLMILRKMARVLPASWMRSSFLKLMMSRPATIQQRTGTFHITCIPHVHHGASLKLPTQGALSFGRVEDRVVARNGQPVVHPVATITLVGNSQIWTGNNVAVLFGEIKTILESGELAAEIPAVQTPVAAL